MNSLLVQQTIERKLELSKIRIKTELNQYLSTHPQQSLNGIAHLININKTTIYSWYDGKYKTPLKKENIEKLANLLKINPLYLLGESDYKISNNENIDLKNLIGENALLGLQNLQKEIDEYEKELKEYTTFDDFDYVGIIGYVIGNVTFWRTLLHEVNRIVKLKTNEYFQNDFERIINKSSDGMVDNPTMIDYEDIIHQVNAKVLNNIFDDYIKTLNIKDKDFEEKVPSPILRKNRAKLDTEKSTFEKNISSAFDNYKKI